MIKKYFFKRLWFIGAAIAAFAANASEVDCGVLPNGMSYYVQHNDNPKGMADFFFAQRAGSVNELDNQRGLAHFLEHLCFNGTEHFPDNTLISYLESIGVKFGANLNAYTSTDETVYNISKVPVARESVVDSCLLILHDWSCGVSMTPRAIDAERGVIVNEWRHRNSATNRQLERALPRLYPASIYGQRMPIGKMEVIENCDSLLIADFYQKWYRPVNQAIVVVGDIDVDKVVKEIKSMFSTIPEGGVKIDSLPKVAENDSPIIICESDPEQAVNLVQLYVKHDSCDDMAAQLATTMIANRFDEIELDPDCPYTYLGVGDVKFLLSRGQKALVMRGVAKAGRSADALKLWWRELARARAHSFSDDELAVAKMQMLKSLNDRREKSSSAANTELARRLVRNYLDRTEIESLDAEIDSDIARLSELTVADAENYVNSVVDLTGKNAVVLSYFPAGESGLDAETLKGKESEMSTAFKSIDIASLEPYAAPELINEILISEPQRGKVVNEQPGHFDGTTVYTLSNGIKVVAWPSSEVAGQVFIRGVGSGGLSQNYRQEDAPSLKIINEGLAVSGAGEMSNNDLKRLGLGRQIATSVDISNTEETIESSTTPADMADAFRMIYLKSTAINPDTLSFVAFLAQERNRLRNQHVNAIQVMGDSIHRNVYSHHPLGAKTTQELLEQADYGKIIEVYRDRFADMSDFTFYVAGDFDRDSLIDCIERYIAPLPTAGRIEKPKDIGYRFTPGNQVVDFTRPMESPVSVVYNFYNGESVYDLPHVLAAGAFGQILKSRLLADLREDRGWTYSIQGHTSVTAGMNGDDAPRLMMPVYIKVEPGHEDEVAAIVDKTVRNLLENGPTEAEMLKVKEYYAKNYKENISDNAYHLIIMKLFDRFGVDMHTDYLQTLESLDNIGQYLQPLTENRSLLIMRPEQGDK